jgi:NAD(P)-dependent dehydrogenase (short-subunit alcohol dehydrogenase family)
MLPPKGPAETLMQIDLTGLRALVTGSTSGIGRATAARLAECGAEVVINGRTRERVEATIQALKAAAPGAAFSAAPGDIATVEGAQAVIAAAGELDILVNNAAWIGFTPAFEITDEDWTKSFEVNVLAGVRLTRHYGPKMRDKGWGRIVFISSESGIQIPTEMIHYGFSKAAELAVSRGFAQARTGTGVTVNAVLPGPTRTEALDGYVKAHAAQRGISEREVEQNFFRNARPSTLLDRFTTPEEVANVVAFVCSKEASAITGAPVRADGGVVQAIT